MPAPRRSTKPAVAEPVAQVVAGDALARLCAEALRDKLAEQVRILRLPTGRMAFDYVVIGSARSDRQINACAEEVRQTLKQRGILHRGGIEGTSGWLLVDAYEVVVHMFLESERARYDLDNLWHDAVELGDGAAVIPSANPDKPRRREQRAAKPVVLGRAKAGRSGARPAKRATSARRGRTTF